MYLSFFHETQTVLQPHHINATETLSAMPSFLGRISSVKQWAS